MTRLSDIPARYHAALAAGRVDVEHEHDDWRHPLASASGDRFVRVYGAPWTTYAVNDLLLPPTAHNVRALAVVLAAALDLDVRGGACAALTRYVTEGTTLHVSVGSLTVIIASGITGTWPRRLCVPALADINPTAPDALFRALVAALCALETA